MRTLEQIKPTWDKIIPAAQRFVDALDGTAVLDKETGLVWAKNPNGSSGNWQTAMDYCKTLRLGGRMGWRLPTIEELSSLVDPSNTGIPALPVGSPFQNIANNYWSSSEYNISAAWYVGMIAGYVSTFDKTFLIGVWPVRGGL
jgi:hypothetical protein